MGCVYLAKNTVNGKCYVGKTVRDLWFRRSSHEDAASGGSCLYFHRALRKYGFGAFEWTVLEEDEDENWLNFVEKRKIAMLGTLVPNGYNLMTGGEGGTHSIESRLKMSLSQRGKKRTEAFKRRVSEVHTGKVNSSETKQKMSESQKKRWADPTPEMVEQAKANGRKTAGRKHSAETKAKMSETRMGHPTSDETKAKLSASLAGNPKLKEASVKNRAKRQEALRRWNKWRDWESCAA